jgi:hypothetical protein
MESKTIFEAISGNVIGVVEEPEILDPSRTANEQLLVKIGVIDPAGGLPESDARIVIEKLRVFVGNLLQEKSHAPSQVQH